MLCANRATARLCEVLWHPPIIEPISKFRNNNPSVRVRHGYSYRPHVVVEVRDGPSRHSLMQWCSFSQSRVCSNRSEIKEATINMSQSKRSCENVATRGDETGEKRLCSDSYGAGLEEFSYEWQPLDVSSEEAVSCLRQVIPVYGMESLARLDDEEDLPATIPLESSKSDGTHLDDSTIDARKEILSNEVRRLRTWEFTDYGRNISRRTDAGMEFTLMSYNILAQDLLYNNFYLYGHCPDYVLDWEFRAKNLLAEIEEAQPDILCLQELTEIHYQEYFKPRLQALGWNSLYKKRTGGKNDGCGIFFKRSLFQLVSYTCVEYFKPDIQHLDRDNIGLIAVLKPFGIDTKLCVATTHLLFNPRRGDIKLSQLQLLLAEMDKLAYEGQGADDRPRYHPAILCGDMNSEPHSPLYQFLNCGELTYDGLVSGDISGQKEGQNRGRTIRSEDLQFPQLGVSQDCRFVRVDGSDRPAPYSKGMGRSLFGNQQVAPSPFQLHHDSYRTDQSPGCLRHRFNFVSAYQHRVGDEVPVTTHHRKASCIVDYIFYSAPNEEGALHLVGTRRLPTSREVADLGGLPNVVLSSDHLSLIAKFDLSRCKS